jgi:glycosyltransferase involved in cell wall biosynthesis
MRLCINTQTPPIKFKMSYNELLEKYGVLDDPLDLGSLEKGIDYEFSPGGVTAMVLPLLDRLMKSGFTVDPIWVSLGVSYPPNLLVNGITVSHVELAEADLRAYSGFKESLWSTIHGLAGRQPKKEEYWGYASYNWVNAEKLLQHVSDVDAFYVQDFQLLLTGQLIGMSAPALLRWHVPFVPENLGKMHRFVLKAMEGFDSVVVSTRRDLEGLFRSSYHGRAYQVYPYIDETAWPPASSSSMEILKEKIKLEADEPVMLLVARMDPMKSQDVAIKALARIKDRVKIRLLLIGNGSFSSSKAGGLGRDKGTTWRSHLKETAKSLGVEDRVTFLGYASDSEVRAAYALSTATIVTSRIEGFGITVLESWINRKPVLVSRGAGSSELVSDASNGYTYDPGDDATLAEKMLLVLGSKNDQMGQNGFETSKQCLVGESAKRVKEILEETVANY